jgi:sterol desaturase/sphingolipid hydroxylase (fatty acid hydroxylase superfamily)
MGVDPFAGSVVSVLVLAAAYVVLFAGGLAFPLRRPTRRIVPRLFTNACMTGLTFAAGALLVRTVAFRVSAWSGDAGIGLLNWASLPAPVEFAAGFLLIDLTFYWWHRANHAVPVMWRFHNAHHIDPDLDVSTAFRFHLVEVAYSTPFRALQVGVFGVSPLLYVVYEFVFQLATLFHHSNVRVPIRIERALNKVFVTPRMHGIHHSVVREETNSDYSVVFRWWDWVHRTLRLGIPQAHVEIGVPGYQEPGDNSLGNALLMPFRAQKPYWHRSGGQRPIRKSYEAGPDAGRLAE